MKNIFHFKILIRFKFFDCKLSKLAKKGFTLTGRKTRVWILWLSFIHRLITNTDRTLDVVFSRFKVFSFTVILRQKPNGVTRRQRWITKKGESMRVTPFGLRVIVNEKTLNLEKMTYSFLFVLLFIYAFIYLKEKNLYQ